MGLRSKKWDWVMDGWMDGWMDTPQTVTTTKAPAVLTIVLYYNCITPISGNHVHAFHTIQPSYLIAYMQPYLSKKIAI